MKKISKPEYTAEFRELTVKRVKEGLTPGAAAKELGVIIVTDALTMAWFRRKPAAGLMHPQIVAVSMPATPFKAN